MQLKGYLAAPMETGTWWRGAEGVRAGWRVAIWVLLLYALSALEAPLVDWLMRPWTQGTLGFWVTLTPFVVAVSELVSLLPVLGATLLMAWAEDTSLASYGLPRSGWCWLVNGSAIGLLWLCVLVLLLIVLGFAAVAPGGMNWLANGRYGVEWLIASLLIAFYEELYCRGYVLKTLARGIGFWPAALATSLWFTLLHGGNTGESQIGLIDILTSGLFFCLTIRKTGSLWWAIGAHALWDFGENFIFGTADSGYSTVHTLLRVVPKGDIYWSGGITGPEGSILSPVLTAALTIAFIAARPGAKNLSPSTAR